MVHDSNVPNPIKINLFANLGAIIEQMAEHNPGNPETEIERLRALIRRIEEESQARIQALEAQNQDLQAQNQDLQALQAQNQQAINTIDNLSDDANSRKFTSF